jgi:adenylate kinase
MIIDILSKHIEMLDEESNGIILDGFPRTVAQAEALEEMLKKHHKEISVLIDLLVERPELIDRLLKRGQLSGRSDDNFETIQKRLEVYQLQTAPVNDFYKSLNKYVSVQGVGSIEEIFGRITDVIDSVK